MFKGYRDHELDPEALEKIPDRTKSPAEVSQILFKHFDHSDEEVLKELVEEPEESETKPTPLLFPLGKVPKVSDELIIHGFDILTPKLKEDVLSKPTYPEQIEVIYSIMSQSGLFNRMSTSNLTELRRNGYDALGETHKRTVNLELMNSNGKITSTILNIVNPDLLHGDGEEIVGYSSGDGSEDNYLP
jgi:hypothetical protein